MILGYTIKPNGPFHTALAFYAITHVFCFFLGDEDEDAVVALVVDVVGCKVAVANLNDESDVNVRGFDGLIEDVETGFVRK